MSTRPWRPGYSKRWARENRVDSVKGVATAITRVEFYRTAVVKGYQTPIDTRC